MLIFLYVYNDLGSARNWDDGISVPIRSAASFEVDWEGEYGGDDEYDGDYDDYDVVVLQPPEKTASISYGYLQPYCVIPLVMRGSIYETVVLV